MGHSMERRNLIVKILKKQCMTFPYYGSHVEKYGEDLIDSWMEDLEDCKTEDIQQCLKDLFKSAERPLMAKDFVEHCKFLQGIRNQQNVDMWSKETLKALYGGDNES